MKDDFKLRIVLKENKIVLGVNYKKFIGIMTYNGKETNQQITYMAANPLTNPNISLVALDSFSKTDLVKGNLLRQIKISKHRYPNSKIVSAVNADFFDIKSNLGQNAATVGPHIRDSNVLFEGYDYKRSISVGIKKDGTPFILKPEFDGYHLDVINEKGEIKSQVKVKINEHLTNPNDVGVFISSFLEPNKIKGSKILIKITEKAIHKKNGIENGRYFIKGKVESITKESLDTIPEDIMVLVGGNFPITKNDIIRIQNRPSGAFKDVYHAVSGIHPLVENGSVIRQTNVAVHPRTAVGLKEDGTLFFVVIDGRQSPKYDGVMLEELGHIMKYFGAVKAVNLDGGGSSTMVLFDEDTKKYVVCNSPCDGGLRRNANGVGFIYTEKGDK